MRAWSREGGDGSGAVCDSARQVCMAVEVWVRVVEGRRGGAGGERCLKRARPPVWPGRMETTRVSGGRRGWRTRAWAFVWPALELQALPGRRLRPARRTFLLARRRRRLALSVQGAARLKVGGGCRGRRTSRWLRMVPGCRSIGSPSSTSARADCDETPVSVCACSTPGETWSTPKRHPSPQAYRASRNSRC